jgi:hypothetical protein
MDDAGVAVTVHHRTTGQPSAHCGRTAEQAPQSERAELSGRARGYRAGLLRISPAAHGGDQIYADLLWDVVEELRGFNNLPRDQRMRTVPAPSLRNELERFYADTYQNRFSQNATADARLRYRP